jgi:hypothetical protein
MDPDQLESTSLFAVSSIEGVLEIPDESDNDTGHVMQDVGCRGCENVF